MKELCVKINLGVLATEFCPQCSLACGLMCEERKTLMGYVSDILFELYWYKQKVSPLKTVCIF